LHGKFAKIFGAKILKKSINSLKKPTFALIVVPQEFE